MIISVFKNGYIAIGEDHSYTPPETIDGVTSESKGHPDCIFSKDVIFDPKTQTIAFDPNIADVVINDIPPPPPKTDAEIKVEIGDKILQEVFEGNPYAQLADLTKSQVITLALLVPIIGKETVRYAYADLITTLEKVSQARVANGLSPFDLSFLD